MSDSDKDQRNYFKGKVKDRIYFLTFSCTKLCWVESLFSVVGRSLLTNCVYVDIQLFKDSVPGGDPLWFGVFNLDQFNTYAQNRAAADQWALVEMTVGQLSGYIQDELQVNDKLKITKKNAKRKSRRQHDSGLWIAEDEDSTLVEDELLAV